MSDLSGWTVIRLDENKELKILLDFHPGLKGLGSLGKFFPIIKLKIRLKILLYFYTGLKGLDPFV